MPRPATCHCGWCAKCKKRIRARERYQALGESERRAIVARRDPIKVKAADRARYYRDWAKRRAAADAYLKANPEKARESNLRWIERNPEKRKAHNAVANAIRDGKLERKPCEVCGEYAHGHHDDYDKPLEVRWLCPLHHAQHHVQERRAA